MQNRSGRDLLETIKSLLKNASAGEELTLLTKPKNTS